MAWSHTGSKYQRQFMKNQLKQGLGNQAAYQVSGWPWITGSEVDPSGSYQKIEFPRVTQEIEVRNTDRYYLTQGQNSGSSPIVIFFGPEPSGGGLPDQIKNNHSWTLLDPGDSENFEIKTDHMYIGNMSGLNNTTANTGAFQVFGNLTGISPAHMTTLTGSGIDE